MTGSHGHTLLKPDDNDSIEDTEGQLVTQQTLDIIKETNGSQVAVNTAIQSAYNRSEQARKYFGDKLTQRENKRVKNLCVAIIRNKNIVVVKHKPQLVVKWTCIEKTAENAGSANGGVVVE